MKADRQARTMLTNATIHATLADATLANLDLGLAGWPTSTPGASPPEQQPPEPCRDPDCTNTRPCPDHDDEDAGGFELTSTERFATQPDAARRDLETYLESSAIANRHLAILARIDQRWAYTGVDATTVKQNLWAIDALIWCDNCSKYGRHETRAKDRTECDFCIEFRQQYKRPPPKEIWDARDARGGKYLDRATILRVLKRIDDERKARHAAERKARREAQEEAS